MNIREYKEYLAFKINNDSVDEKIKTIFLEVLELLFYIDEKLIISITSAYKIDDKIIDVTILFTHDYTLQLYFNILNCELYFSVKILEQSFGGPCQILAVDRLIQRFNYHFKTHPMHLYNERLYKFKLLKI